MTKIKNNINHIVVNQTSDQKLFTQNIKLIINMLTPLNYILFKIVYNICKYIYIYKTTKKNGTSKINYAKLKYLIGETGTDVGE